MEVTSFQQAQSACLAALSNQADIGMLRLLVSQMHALISPPSRNCAAFKTFNRSHAFHWGLEDLKEFGKLFVTLAQNCS